MKQSNFLSAPPKRKDVRNGMLSPVAMGQIHRAAQEIRKRGALSRVTAIKHCCRLQLLLSAQSRPPRPGKLPFQRVVMAELGMACTIHQAGDCLDLLGLLCELRACLELLGEPARIGTAKPPRECFGHQRGLIKRVSALR